MLLRGMSSNRDLSGSDALVGHAFGISLAAAAGAWLALWVVAFMIMQVCTSDHSCTLQACPPECGRPETVLLFALPVVAAGGLLSGFLWKSRGAIALLAVAAVAVVSLVAMLAS